MAGEPRPNAAARPRAASSVFGGGKPHHPLHREPSCAGRRGSEEVLIVASRLKDYGLAMHPAAYAQATLANIQEETVRKVLLDTPHGSTAS